MRPARSCALKCTLTLITTRQHPQLVPVRVNISVRGCIREGPNQEGGKTVLPKGKTSSSEVLGSAFNVVSSAKSQNTSFKKKKITSLPPGNLSIWNFMKPNPLVSVRTGMRGNFL